MCVGVFCLNDRGSDRWTVRRPCWWTPARRRIGVNSFFVLVDAIVLSTLDFTVGEKNSATHLHVRC